MQAYIRLDARRGKDFGLVIVSEADFYSDPIFFSLQRFTDGKYLTANSLWRSNKEELRAGEYHWVNGILTIVVGPDILYELETGTTYRMTINGSKSFPLALSRDVLHLLKQRADLQTALDQGDAIPDTVPAAEAVTVHTPDVRTHRARKQHHWKTATILAGLGLIGLGVVYWKVCDTGPMQFAEKPIVLSTDATAGADAAVTRAVFVDKSGKPAAQTDILAADPDGLQADTQSISHSLRSSAVMSGISFFSTEGLPGGGSHNTAASLERNDDALSYTRLVHDYLESGATTPALNVALAKKVRVATASTPDTDTSFMLLQQAADQGYTEAMYMVAQFYDPLCPLPHGSIEASPGLAREWYKRAEAGGLVQAIVASDALYQHLQGLAEQGDSEAIQVLRNW